ncbi:hypothetical protein BRD00_10070 [Halobacteriales archaeon QS_8_69_26]|nr:MAG: hypothetical protein BRD00_10070 [Halobacteriales archaeon QS_8_69_26]
MSGRKYEINTEVDASGTVAAFLFGGVVGFLLVYPALPAQFQAIDPSLLTLDLGPVGSRLIGGIALFLLFVLGVIFLNWFFIHTDK